MPWGRTLEHLVEPPDLLGLPLAFTQNELLSAEEFAKAAAARGVHIRVGQLLELHRRRALVPFLRVSLRPSRSSAVVQVAASAMDGYGQYGSSIALVVAGARHGLLADPGVIPYRRWDGGLPLPTAGGTHRTRRCSTARTSCWPCA